MSGDFCTACYGCHRTDADKQRCAQAQQQNDAAQKTMRQDFAKRFGYTCPWCGSVHTTRQEIAECREVG